MIDCKDAASSPLKPDKQMSATAPKERNASGLMNVPEQPSQDNSSPWRDSCRLTYKDKNMTQKGMKHKRHHSNSSSPSSDRGSIHYAANKSMKMPGGMNLRASNQHTT